MLLRSCEGFIEKAALSCKTFGTGSNSRYSLDYYEQNTHLDDKGGVYTSTYRSHAVTNIKPGINLHLDIRLPHNFKLCAGLSYNTISFTTPFTTISNYQTISKQNQDSDSTYYTGTSYFSDHISVKSFSPYFGGGYSLKWRKFYFDLDAAVKMIICTKININRTYDGSVLGNSPTAFTIDLQKNNTISSPIAINAAALSFNFKVQYQLWKALYVNAGVNYIYYDSHSVVGGNGIAGRENVFLSLSNFNSFSAFAGLTVVLNRR